ncbi:hypothetical protein TNCV_521221 [Trichonephila clavipes]|nr:hypothetical protein TNCV_521221 [Trichonephila clavipes]
MLSSHQNTNRMAFPAKNKILLKIRKVQFVTASLDGERSQLVLTSSGGLQGVKVGELPARPEHPFQLHQNRSPRMNTQRLVSQTVIN